MEVGPEAVTAYHPIILKELFPQGDTSGRVEDQRAKSQKRSQGRAELTKDPQRLKVQIKGNCSKASTHLHQPSQQSWGIQRLNHCKDEDTTEVRPHPNC